MQQIVPNFWFHKNAEEAGDFYASVLPKTTAEVTGRYPTEGLQDFQRDFAGEPVTVDVTIDGFIVRLLNAGGEFTPNPSLSIFLNFDPLFFEANPEEAREALDATWAGLAEGGSVLMPLDEYPFSRRYGWVQDRYGVSWQLTLSDVEGEPRPFVIPALMFAGSAQNKAEEMTDFYRSVLPDSAEGSKFRYGTPTGPASADALMYSEVKLCGQWFAAMDSGVEQPWSFTPGVSLQLSCHGQEEIDRIWEAFSANPDNEVCGWLTDKAGLSWQIVPDNMDELLARPNGFQNLMGMKKLVIDEF